MNINREEFIKEMYELSFTPYNCMAKTIIKNTLDKHEIKEEPVDCSESGCVNFKRDAIIVYDINSVPIERCGLIRCLRNSRSVDLYEKKQKELNKIFVGAPVMVQNGGSWGLTQYVPNTNKTFEAVYRLPTVEEAPRNVWLAPWFEMPEELKKLRTLVQYSEINLIAESNSGWEKARWLNINAIMILEDLKNE